MIYSCTYLQCIFYIIPLPFIQIETDRYVGDLLPEMGREHDRYPLRRSSVLNGHHTQTKKSETTASYGGNYVHHTSAAASTFHTEATVVAPDDSRRNAPARPPAGGDRTGALTKEQAQRRTNARQIKAGQKKMVG
jgi:hypothetical protein